MPLNMDRKKLLGLIIIMILAFVVVVATLMPGYTSPNSRLWSSSLGYPSFLRKLQKPIPVKVTRVELQNMVRTITADGMVEYLTEIPVNIEVLGVVTFLGTNLGEKVHTGQVLLRVDSGGHESRVAKLDVERERNKYAEKKSDFEREQEAYGKGLISRVDLEQRRRELEEQKIIYQKAKEDYENSIIPRNVNVVGKEPGVGRYAKGPAAILSPADGTVFMKDISLGENLVRAKEGALKIGDRQVFRANFDQRYIDWIKEGQDLTIYLAAFPGQQFQGKVQKIDKRISMKPADQKNNPPQNTFMVWAQLADDQKNIFYGMNGYCVIKQKFSSLSVPESALMRYSGQEGMVMIVNSDKKLELRAVTYTLSLDGRVAVLTGLAAGDTVVTSGQVGLEAGDMVSFKTP